MCLTNTKESMKRNLLKNEAKFAENLGQMLSDDLIEEQKREVETLFTLDHGGIVKACNRYMQRTIKAIKKGYISLDVFSIKDAEAFSELFNSNKLDEKLQDELSHLLFGADERARYLK